MLEKTDTTTEVTAKQVESVTITEPSLSPSPSPVVQDDPLKKFKCEYCDYRTKYMGDLRKHLRRHLLQKPLKCGHCDFEGVLNHDITQHCKKKHKDKEPIIVFNQISTKRLIAPIKRRRRVKGVIPAATSTDEYVDVTTIDAGTSSSEMGNLLKSCLDGGLKKYKCKICEHTSDSYIAMRADHIRAHFKPFECSYCKKR